MRSRSFFQHPLMCPRGHRQISWFAAEKMAHCWLCEKDYPLSDCFGTPSTFSSTEQELELPEILKIAAGEMEKASSDSQKNWKKESPEK
ncbi:MAG: hypothetical protein LJE88_06910 [Deltaproteobacteria bacterium]|nr:hypothetical protein [Deltaproteobacteria bacterium]